MNLLGRALELYVRGVDRWLDRAGRDPVAAQRRVLAGLLAKGRKTVFGYAHGLDSVRNAAEFARAVPIRDYVDYVEWVDRMLAGDPDVCWPGAVKYFAQTSGTTAGDKRIPVTADMQRSNRRAALAMFAWFARRRRGILRELMDGKLLFLGGSTTLTETDAGAWIGDLSGIATRSIHWPLSSRYEPGPEIALLDNWEAKIQRVAERVIDRDIRFVTGMPSWVKILFDRLCAMRGIDPEGGISRIWPNLSLFVHGGVNFAPYRPTFARYFAPGTGPHYQEVYPASEGFIAIQAEADDPGMEMLVENGLFFEFVPLDQWGRPDAPRLTIGQVETDVPYSLVLTTNAGLWAYDIGDVVRFVSLRPPRIVFAGRNRHFVNAFGENVIGEHVSQAVATAAAQLQVEPTAFTVAPLYPGPDRPVGAHQYIMEFGRELLIPHEVLARLIDQAVQAVNNDYTVKRSSGGMSCVELLVVPPGTFYRWMKQRGKLGGQHKVPVCANDRRYADELVALAGQEAGSAS